MLTTKQALYKHYLQSASWQDIRKQVLERDNYKCQSSGCDNPGYDVHHVTYARFGHENLSDLVTLCRACHENIHNALKGTKSPRGIGTRALFNYLNKKQKATIYKEFNLTENELYGEIYLRNNPRICDFAAKLLNFDYWYSQTNVKKLPADNVKHLSRNGGQARDFKRTMREQRNNRKIIRYYLKYLIFYRNLFTTADFSKLFIYIRKLFLINTTKHLRQTYQWER